jgi:hypothetical protein
LGEGAGWNVAELLGVVELVPRGDEGRELVECVEAGGELPRVVKPVLPELGEPCDSGGAPREVNPGLEHAMSAVLTLTLTPIFASAMTTRMERRISITPSSYHAVLLGPGAAASSCVTTA